MSVAIYSRGKKNKCGRCQVNVAQGKRITFTVDISTALTTLGIKASDLPRIDTSGKVDTRAFPTAIIAETEQGKLQPLTGITRHVKVEDLRFSDLDYLLQHTINAV